MKENKEKREFARQLEQIAETLTQAVKNNEGLAFILIGTDRKEQPIKIMSYGRRKRINRN